MADKSEVLGVKLTDLWEAGKVSLPLVAEAYAGASGTMHGVGGDEKDVIVNPRRPSDSFPLVPGKNAFVMGKAWEDAHALGEMYPHWSHVRATLQEAIARTAENLRSAATALLLITDHYAGTDKAAADELNRNIAERANAPAVAAPPASVTPVAHPGDPQPADPSDIDNPFEDLF